jgi:diguanylate cyclase (GGDEF)-like protein/PAS domain S-box-containing protein
LIGRFGTLPAMVTEPFAARPSDRVPWGIWLFVAALGILSALLLVYLVVAPGRYATMEWIDDLAQCAIPLMAAAVWAGYTFRHRHAFSRANPLCRSALCFSLSAACFGIGQSMWTYCEDVLHVSPSPSWADAPFLAAYPFLFVGTFSLSSRSLSRTTRLRVILDELICLTSLIAISWYFILGPTLLRGDIWSLKTIIAAAYPAGDILVLSGLLLLVMNLHTRRYRPSVAALLAGVLSIIVADTVYLYETLHAVYRTGGLADVAWPLGYGLLVMSALLLTHLSLRDQPTDEEHVVEEARPGPMGFSEAENGWQVLIPSVLVLGCWALVGLALATPGHKKLLPVMAVTSGALACLVVVRQVMTSRDNDRLLRHLRDAWQETINRAEEVERVNGALQESQEMFKSAFEHTANGMALVAPDGHWLQVNRALCEMSGYTDTELLVLRFGDMVHPDDRAEIEEAMAALARSDIESYRSERRCFRKDGQLFWVAVTISTVRDLHRSTTCFISQIQDVTEHKRSEAARRDTERRYRSLVETSADGIIFVDSAGAIMMANRQAAKLHGYDDVEHLIGLDWMYLVAADFYDAARRERDRVMQGGVLRALEYPARRKEGSSFPAEMSAARILNEDGQPIGYMASIRDVTERHLAQERLAYQAQHDALTGLPNRSLLRDRLDEAIAAHEEYEQPAALLLLDLNRFKEVNDTFGHHYGDALLVELGRRLVNALRSDDIIARLGGDEFAALLPDAGLDEAKLVAERMLLTIDEPFRIEEQDFYVGISIGIALCPDHGADAAVLMRRADIAMYVAKRTSNGYMVYSSEQDDTNPVRHELMRDLRRAIDHGGLVLHYQPQVDLRDGNALQVEALIRWEHAEGGFAPPASFVPIAEETGLIKPLTTWVLNQALRQCSLWKAQGLDVRVAVNLSARSLHDAGLVQAVKEALARWNIAPSQLCLEITESAIIVDPDRAMLPLAELHAMGVRFAIDDFGTGYTSLSYLQRLPIDQIKVDRSFVMDITENNDNAVIVRSILDLAHSLGMEVVAEGVESVEVGDALRDLGCDLVQGYHICRPVSAPEYRSWYGDWVSHATAGSKILGLTQSAIG